MSFSFFKKLFHIFKFRNLLSDQNLPQFFFCLICIFWHYCRSSSELKMFLLILGYIEYFNENFVFEGL